MDYFIERGGIDENGRGGSRAIVNDRTQDALRVRGKQHRAEDIAAPLGNAGGKRNRQAQSAIGLVHLQSITKGIATCGSIGVPTLNASACCSCAGEDTAVGNINCLPIRADGEIVGVIACVQQQRCRRETRGCWLGCSAANVEATPVRTVNIGIDEIGSKNLRYVCAREAG